MEENSKKISFLSDELETKDAEEYESITDLLAKEGVVETSSYSEVEAEMLKKCRKIYNIAKDVQDSTRRMEKIALSQGNNSKDEAKERDYIHDLMEDIKQSLVDQSLAAGDKPLERKVKEGSVFGTIFKIITWFLMIIVLSSLVTGVMLFGGDVGNTPPRTIFGYSTTIVISGSMQSVYPADSLIIIRQVDPDTLEIGDDITFITERERVVTHRIIDIYENYDGYQRGFRTQGVDNDYPDDEVAFAPNVIGKVVYDNHSIGQVVMYARDNFPLILGTIVMIGLMIFIIRRFLVSNS